MEKVLILKTKVANVAKEIVEDERGMELLQLILVALLAVVLAGGLLKFFDTSFTEIGGLMVNKIKSIFSL